MTIIVTGGAGFIGSNFVFHMLKAHPHCLSGQADLRWQSVHAGACHGQPEFPVCQAGYLRP